MSEYDEQLDLVNDNDQVIGRIGRAEGMKLQVNGGRYLRTSCAFIRNTQGQFWIPRRTSTKRIAPNGLDFAMAEHIGVGESYLDAAIRGFDEELNTIVTEEQLRLVGILGPRFFTVAYFGAIYLYNQDEAPQYNPDDFQSAEWLTAEDAIARIQNGEAAKDLLIPALRLILLEDQASKR